VTSVEHAGADGAPLAASTGFSLPRPSLTAPWLWAAGLLALALAIRIAFALHVGETAPERDGFDYNRIGLSLAAGNGFPSSLVIPGTPAAVRPPAYPVFLAAVYKVFGGHLIAARLVQALVGTLTVGLIGALGWVLFGRRVALVAVAIAAVYPELVLMDSALLSEVLYVPLTLAAVTAACLARRAERKSCWAIAAGILAGLSILTRQNGFLILLPLFLLVWVRPSGRGARDLLAPAAMLVCAMAVVLPWTIQCRPSACVRAGGNAGWNGPCWHLQRRGPQ